MGDSPNRISGVVGLRYGKKSEVSRKVLEKPAGERDSRVSENGQMPGRILSTAGHEKPCRNPGRPRSKAKYYLATDSEEVP